MATLLEFVIILVIAGICGGFAQGIFGRPRRNFLTSMAIGVIGAYLGTFIAKRIGLPRFVECQ